MRIFEIILFEYILGYILQGFAFGLGLYAFCVKKLEMPKYLLISGIFIVISFITRLLILELIPSGFGIHTILDLVCLFLLGLLVLKVTAFAAIRSIAAITILLIFTEMISIFSMTNILGSETFNSMMSDRVAKAIVALPSSVLFAVLIAISYIVLLRIKKKKSGRNGEIRA